MFFRASTLNSTNLSTFLAGKLLTGGLILIGIGILILMFPELLALVVAGFCFLGGGGLLMAAWRVWWGFRRAKRSSSFDEGEYEEVSWKEVQ